MKHFPIRYLLLTLILLLFLAACGGSGGANDSAPADAGDTDADTGLPVNPETTPDGPFIIDGTIASINLTPQTAPEYVIRIPSGRTFRVRAQGLADTFYEDGTAVVPSEIRQSMAVRATVTYDPATLLYTSEDLVLLW